MIREVPRLVARGEDRPHRQQRLNHQDRLRDDDHRVREEVPAVGRIQQEHRVGDDAQRRHHRHEDEQGRGLAGAERSSFAVESCELRAMRCVRHCVSRTSADASFAATSAPFPSCGRGGPAAFRTCERRVTFRWARARWRRGRRPSATAPAPGARPRATRASPTASCRRRGLRPSSLEAALRRRFERVGPAQRRVHQHVVAERTGVRRLTARFGDVGRDPLRRAGEIVQRDRPDGKDLDAEDRRRLRTEPRRVVALAAPRERDDPVLVGGRQLVEVGLEPQRPGRGCLGRQHPVRTLGEILVAAGASPQREPVPRRDGFGAGLLVVAVRERGGPEAQEWPRYGSNTRSTGRASPSAPPAMSAASTSSTGARASSVSGR